MSNPLRNTLLVKAISLSLLLIGCTGRSERVAGGVPQKSPPKAITLTGKAKVYLENSGSMNGYLHDGNTVYRKALTTVLWGIYNNDTFGDSRLYTHLINDQVYPVPFNGVLRFVTELKPGTSPFKVGDTSTSNFNLMLGNLLQKHEANDVSVFISDCIYSGDNLQLQQQNTKGLFVNKIKRVKDFTVSVVKLNADFSGMYYCAGIPPRKINNERPLYIWFMGSQPLIKALFKTLRPEQLSGYASYYTLSAQKVVKPQYTVSNINGQGRFQTRHRDAIPEVLNIQNRGQLQFAIPVVLPADLFASDYLRDISNYQSNMPQLKVIKSEVYNERAVLQASRPKHMAIHSKVNPNYMLYVKSSRPFPNGQLDIQLMYKKPSWISKTSTLNSDSSSAPNQTFGLQYLMDGLTEAFQTGPTPVVTFSVNLN